MAADSIDLDDIAALAARLHGQQRDPDGELHIRHCERVAQAMSGAEAQATALLHDVLEDTDATTEALQEANVPDAVVRAVTLLTRRSGEP